MLYTIQKITTASFIKLWQLWQHSFGTIQCLSKSDPRHVSCNFSNDLSDLSNSGRNVSLILRSQKVAVSKRELRFVEPANGQRYWDNLQSQQMLSAVKYVAGYNFVCHQSVAQRTNASCVQCTVRLLRRKSQLPFPELCPNSIELNYYTSLITTMNI